MFDAVITSDWHLGSKLCLHKRLMRFMAQLPETKRFIVVGDLLDNPYGQLAQEDWHVLLLLARLTSCCDVIWVRGNHDENAEPIAQALDIAMVEEFDFCSGMRKINCLHGDRYDDFLLQHPLLTRVGDTLYSFLQKMDKTHRLAIWAKHSSKDFMACLRKVREEALNEAFRQGFDVVVCGHTHNAEHTHYAGQDYFNSGCWTELPGTYVTVKDGVVELKRFEG